MDIYAASEAPIEGVTSKLIYDRIEGVDQVHYLKTQEAILEHLEKNYSDGEGVIITIGAGDIYQLSRRLLED